MRGRDKTPGMSRSSDIRLRRRAGIGLLFKFHPASVNLFKPPLNLEIPADLMKVMHSYEGSCVMSCCGVACLDLDAQRAIDGMLDFGLETAESALRQLGDMQKLAHAHHGPVVSDQNAFGEKWKSSEDALLFLQQIHASLSAAINHVRHHGLPDIQPTQL